MLFVKSMTRSKRFAVSLRSSSCTLLVSRAMHFMPRAQHSVAHTLVLVAAACRRSESHTRRRCKSQHCIQYKFLKHTIHRNQSPSLRSDYTTLSHRQPQNRTSPPLLHCSVVHPFICPSFVSTGRIRRRHPSDPPRDMFRLVPPIPLASARASRRVVGVAVSLTAIWMPVCGLAVRMRMS